MLSASLWRQMTFTNSVLFSSETGCPAKCSYWHKKMQLFAIAYWSNCNRKVQLFVKVVDRWRFIRHRLDRPIIFVGITIHTDWRLRLADHEIRIIYVARQFIEDIIVQENIMSLWPWKLRNGFNVHFKVQAKTFHCVVQNPSHAATTWLAIRARTWVRVNCWTYRGKQDPHQRDHQGIWVALWQLAATEGWTLWALACPMYIPCKVQVDIQPICHSDANKLS